MKRSLTEILSLDEADAQAARRLYVQLEESHIALGGRRAQLLRQIQALKAAYKDEEAALVQRVQDSENEYVGLVHVLAQKYVPPGGEYDFRPELGAFVQTPHEDSQ